jgi:hypothetical protein
MSDTQHAETFRGFSAERASGCYAKAPLHVPRSNSARKSLSRCFENGLRITAQEFGPSLRCISLNIGGTEYFAETDL